MLSVRKLEVFYGPIRAVRGIDLDVQAGEIVALIGANGAGKTSTLRAIAGLLPFRGEIAYQGRALVPNKAELNLRAGLSLVPEGRGMLGRMSVEDNLRMGIYARSDRAEAAVDIERMFERFPILKERRAAMANLLSGGEQQMLAIARALASGPKLLLLDEPVAGMNHDEADELRRLLLRLNEEGLTILLIEHDMAFVMNLCHELYVLDFGVRIATGEPAAIRSDPVVLDAYLGSEAAC